MRLITRRRSIVLLAGVAGVIAVVLFGKWLDATRHGGQKYAEPFRIAGNLYYVGANDVTSFLITGPEGDVLIDGGYPGTPPLIMASIAKLGFKITDVKVLLNSHAHFDHAGGLAELQKASGAELWVSEGDADAVASGGVDDASNTFLPARILAYIGIIRYPAPRVDHRFKDGAKIQLGTIELTAHVTGGHTRGCTTWTFPVRDGDRVLNVVDKCSLNLPAGVRLVEPERYPGVRADFERSFRTLRSLPVDIWVTSHAKEFGRWRKFQESKHVADPVAPFIDRDGYYRSIDSSEMRFRKVLAEQEGRR
jgi:metallo-beta-lactamase class B